MALGRWPSVLPWMAHPRGSFSAHARTGFGERLANLARHVRQGLREALEHHAQRLVGGGKGRRQQNLVPGVTVARGVRRADKKAVLDRVILDAMAGLELVGEEGLAVALIDQLDSEQETSSTGVANHRVALQLVLQLVAKLRPALANTLNQLAFDEYVDHCKAHRTRHGSAVPCVAEIERARARCNRVVYVLPAQHSAQWRIARAKSLADRDDVRLDRKLLVGEPCAHASQASHHFVEADQE